MSNIISLRHLSKSYSSSKAVDDLSLTVERGEFFGFLGPNGAGKTTTIRMVTGMIPPDNGEILIEEKKVEHRQEIASRIGVMPESRGQYGWMTAWEYLRFFSSLFSLSNDKQHTHIGDLLEKVGLQRTCGVPISAFSRGMKQRLALARSLVNHPSLLILDEPTLGLDPQGQQDIQTLLLDLHKQGVTVFLSSHLLQEVSKLCTRIGIIHKGKLVKTGTMKSLQSEMGFQSTYTVRIRGTLPKGRPSLFGDVHDIHEEAGETLFAFAGSDEDANSLIDRLRKEGKTILAFHPQNADLTDIFLSVTRS